MSKFNTTDLAHQQTQLSYANSSKPKDHPFTAPKDMAPKYHSSLEPKDHSSMAPQAKAEKPREERSVFSPSDARFDSRRNSPVWGPPRIILSRYRPLVPSPPNIPFLLPFPHIVAHCHPPFTCNPSPHTRALFPRL